MNNRPLGIGDFLIELKEAQTTVKGDTPGHEFHGNQYSDGGGSSRGDSGESSSSSGGKIERVSESHPHHKRIGEIVDRYGIVNRVLAGKVTKRMRPLWEKERNNLEYEYSTLIDDEGPSK